MNTNNQQQACHMPYNSRHYSKPQTYPMESQQWSDPRSWRSIQTGNQELIRTIRNECRQEVRLTNVPLQELTKAQKRKLCRPINCETDESESSEVEDLLEDSVEDDLEEPQSAGTASKCDETESSAEDSLESHSDEHMMEESSGPEASAHLNRFWSTHFAIKHQFNRTNCGFEVPHLGLAIQINDLTKSGWATKVSSMYGDNTKLDNLWLLIMSEGKSLETHQLKILKLSTLLSGPATLSFVNLVRNQSHQLTFSFASRDFVAIPENLPDMCINIPRYERKGVARWTSDEVQMFIYSHQEKKTEAGWLKESKIKQLSGKELCAFVSKTSSGVAGFRSLGFRTNSADMAKIFSELIK